MRSQSLACRVCGWRPAFVARAVPLLLAGLVVLCLPVRPFAAGAPGASVAGSDEYQVKAAFLYNFAKFVQWPAQEGPLVIAVIGDDTFSTRLEEVVRARPINGRAVVVKRLGPGETVTQVQMLFIGAGEARRTAEILRQLAGVPVLTVGETPPFLREGGIVRFFVEGSRLRFQINAAMAEKGGLKLSSQVLGLAAP